MSEVIPSKLNELIAQNTTRQEFIERYKQLASSTDKSSDASIFDENADDAIVNQNVPAYMKLEIEDSIVKKAYVCLKNF